jgi:hypothetical protein
MAAARFLRALPPALNRAGRTFCKSSGSHRRRCTPGAAARAMACSRSARKSGISPSSWDRASVPARGARFPGRAGSVGPWPPPEDMLKGGRAHWFAAYEVLISSNRWALPRLYCCVPAVVSLQPRSGVVCTSTAEMRVLADHVIYWQRAPSSLHKRSCASPSPSCMLAFYCSDAACEDHHVASCL